ncbi:hypothetical protein [Candidatus Mycoplasma haematohominis]|uniref:hypothetical protein n=1 Tax=Candidatus Mycoplasma haematohominis TaxID=1494318 RepID=UPI001C0A7777|nr:hypothetical protein [Candidatus Mycoplasma haemohominis]
MTPQAAVGAGLGGLAAAGAGGTGIAYAAGAFGGKESKTDESSKETYLSKASKPTLSANKKYIGEDGQDTRVKSWLQSSDQGTQYKQDLGNSLSEMTLTEDTGKPTDEMINKLKTPGNLEASEAETTYNYTKKWCEVKKVVIYDSSRTGEFDIFQKVCFVSNSDA